MSLEGFAQSSNVYGDTSCSPAELLSQAINWDSNDFIGFPFPAENEELTHFDDTTTELLLSQINGREFPQMIKDKDVNWSKHGDPHPRPDTCYSQRMNQVPENPNGTCSESPTRLETTLYETTMLDPTPSNSVSPPIAHQNFETSRTRKRKASSPSTSSSSGRCSCSETEDFVTTLTSSRMDKDTNIVDLARQQAKKAKRGPEPKWDTFIPHHEFLEKKRCVRQDKPKPGSKNTEGLDEKYKRQRLTLQTSVMDMQSECLPKILQVALEDGDPVKAYKMAFHALMNTTGLYEAYQMGKSLPNTNTVYSP